MLTIFITLILNVHAVFRSDGILIYCKDCKENVTTSDQLINIKSEQSVSIRNESFAHEHGIIVQEFINPGGYHFDLVTVKQAKVVEKGARVSEHSFFAGFDWTIVVCPKCENHIGWAFTPSHSKEGAPPTFYALIHDKLFYEMEGATYVARSYT